MEEHCAEPFFASLVLFLWSRQIIDGMEFVTPAFGIVSPFIEDLHHVGCVEDQGIGVQVSRILSRSKPPNV